MRFDERLGLARQAYERAVVLARAKTTSASWRRLRTAARNLTLAQREWQRDWERGLRARSVARAPWLPRPVAPGVGGVHIVRLPVGPPASRRGEGATGRRTSVPPRSWPCVWVEAWRERERSLKLVAQAQALTAALRALGAESGAALQP